MLHISTPSNSHAPSHALLPAVLPTAFWDAVDTVSGPQKRMLRSHLPPSKLDTPEPRMQYRQRRRRDRFKFTSVLGLPMVGGGQGWAGAWYWVR